VSTTPPAAAVTLSTSTLAFGNTAVGTTAAAQSVTVTNTGGSTLTGLGISISGTGFALSADSCGTSLAAAASCSFSVTYAPTSATSGTGTVMIADSATGSPQLVTLSGTGTASGVMLSTSSLAFPNTDVVPAGTTSVMTVTITNTGNGTLNFTASPTITGSSVFTVSANTCGTSLAPAAQCAISVTFTPTAQQAYTGTLTIMDNANPTTQSVALTGTGAAPIATFSTTTVNEGNVLVNSTGTETVSISDTGNGPLYLTSFLLSSGNASSFAVTNNICGTTLAAGSTCDFTISFTPATTGSFSTMLTVTDNAANSPQTLQLSGTATTQTNACTTTNTTSPAQTAPTPNYAGAGFSGKVMAGTQPVIGATVKVYSAGATGNGSTPTLLYTTSMVTPSDGSFTVPATFTCPYSNSVLYAVATGGHAGSSGAANAGIVLSAVLGTCNSITGAPTFIVNEVTTAATAWSMAQFLSAGGKIGATATNSGGIGLAAGTFANLVNALAGSSPGTYFPATGTAPTAKINQVADLLNSCIVSTGASSSACTQLYSLTATSAGTPTNTLDAAMNLAQNPGANVAALYTASLASTAYTPVLTAAPLDWTLFVNYTGGGMNDPSAISIDSTGKVWVANYFSVASLFTNVGAPVFASGITGDFLENSYGGAVNVSDVMFIANEESVYAANNGLGSVSTLNSSGPVSAYGEGGLNFPIAISFDTAGVTWVVDYGNSHVTELVANTGAPLSGTSGYTTSQFVFPVAVANNSKCNAYIANQSSNTITFVSADGSTYGSYAVGDGPSGVAVDASDNVWSANYYDNSVGLVSAATGKVASGTGFVGGGIDHPQGIAIDGKGTVWVANYRSPSGYSSVLSELAAAGSANPGQALSPAIGWGGDAGMLEPFALAIDASGNIWITNFGSNTVTEFVGIAAPVKTPLLGPVRTP
jgi:hypothetical protein